MLKHRYFFLALLWAFFISPYAAALNDFEQGELYLKDQAYSKAYKSYERYRESHPASPNNKTLLMHLSYAYFQENDYVNTFQTADTFLRLYPHDRHADYILFLKAMSQMIDHRSFLQKKFNINLANLDVEHYHAAFYDFKDLLLTFPKSKYRKAAVYQLRHIRNILALHELNIGKFYFKKKAYIASAKRAKNIIIQFPGSPYLKESLTLLKDSYTFLGLDHSAAIIQKLPIFKCHNI
jgi:outer membrane protein assembly factor BamD